MEKNQEKDEQIKVLKTQIEKLNNETKSNREKFIDIAKQIQKINSRTKIDPIQERKWRLEKLEGTKYELYIQDREQKHKRKHQQGQPLQKYTIQQQQQQERCWKIKWVLDVSQ